MRSSCVLFLFAVLAVSAADARSGGSVIQKVIEMLEDNKGKVAKDLAAEEQEMKEYAEFCDDEATEKAYSIKEGERKIGDLNAAADDAAAQIKGGEEQIATLGTDIAGKDKDLSAAEATRKAEKSDFEANEKTLLSSIEQLEKAIVMVKRGDKAPEFLQAGKDASKRSNPRALAEALSKTLGSVIDAAWIPEGSTRVLKGFIQSEEGSDENNDLSLHQPEAKTEEKPGGVLQTLEDMKTKAEETLSAARNEEMKGGFNFQMVKQSLVTAKEAAEKKLSDTKALIASLGETMGKAKAELVEVKKTKVADKDYLESLEKECKEAAKNWEARQAEAKAEMAAIDKAKEILSEKVKVLVQHDDDYYNADTQDTAEQTPVRKRLVAHLRDLGHEFKSYALAELAGEAAADPFEKVRGVIQDMIGKLVTEANEEATQHAFCQEETAKSKKESEEKQMTSDKLQNRMESASARQAQLKELIGDLQKQLAENAAAEQEATKIRAEEKASNAKASKDYKDAAEAVTEAISVLKEYYASASLVQTKAAAQGDAASAIIGILETSEEEFTKMYMETEADEKEAEAVYQKMMNEGAIAKAAKAAEIKGAESEIKSLEVAGEEAKEDYKMATKELDAVMEYLEKLKPQCETKAITYEEKKAKREQEIEGLKEALSILDAPALVQVHKH